MTARKEISKYTAVWFMKKNIGRFYLWDTDKKLIEIDGKTSVEVKDPNVYSVIIDILRNEKPVYIYPPTGALQTDAEPVGEESED